MKVYLALQSGEATGFAPTALTITGVIFDVRSDMQYACGSPSTETDVIGDLTVSVGASERLAP